MYDNTVKKYDLHSIVCHSGKSPTTAHYWSILIYDDYKISADDVCVNSYHKRLEDTSGIFFFFWKRHESTETLA